MSRKISFGAALAMALLLVAASIPLTMLYAQRVQNKIIPNLAERVGEFRSIEEIRGVVAADYYAGVNPDSLTQELVRGYIAGLDDPACRYLSAEEYKAYTQRMDGRQPDLGLEFAYQPDLELGEYGGILLSYVRAGSPAAASGLQPGDQVWKVEVSGKAVFTAGGLNMGNYEDQLAKLYNVSTDAAETQSTAITITYKREGDLKPPAHVLIGSSVETISTDLLKAWAPEGEEGGLTVGYIKIFAFYKNTPGQLESAVKELSANGATSFIFDVRGCAEGTVDSACEAIDLFIQERPGNMARVERVDGTPVQAWSSEPNSIYSYTQKSIAILINRYTAGPAELFAYDMRAYTGAILAGQHTRGVTTMVKPFALSQVGGAALLTVGTIFPYEPPKGTVFDDWDGTGVKPGPLTNGVVLDLAGEGQQLQSAIAVLTKPTE